MNAADLLTQYAITLAGVAVWLLADVWGALI